MGQYRVSRNLEISTIDYLTTEINTAWSGVSVVRSFSEVDEKKLPVVCIRLGTTIHDRVEIGTTSTLRIATIFIDIFATDDGQRLDLKDFIISKIKYSWDYREYTVNNGTSTYVVNGKINCLTIKDTEVSPAANKSDLPLVDRYRHLITIQVQTGKVEV